LGPAGQSRQCNELGDRRMEPGAAHLQKTHLGFGWRKKKTSNATNLGTAEWAWSCPSAEASGEAPAISGDPFSSCQSLLGPVVLSRPILLCLRNFFSCTVTITSFKGPKVFTLQIPRCETYHQTTKPAVEKMIMVSVKSTLELPAIRGDPFNLESLDFWESLPSIWSQIFESAVVHQLWSF